MAIDGETVETVSDFIFLDTKITADSDCSHEIKRRLLLGRKVMTNLDSILKSRDITLPTKVNLVKAMVSLCDPVDCSPPGSSVHRILQARILEWVAISFSRDLPDPRFKPRSPGTPALQADFSPLSHRGSP